MQPHPPLFLFFPDDETNKEAVKYHRMMAAADRLCFPQNTRKMATDGRNMKNGSGRSWRSPPRSSVAVTLS